jgi:hypothetical protein
MKKKKIILLKFKRDKKTNTKFKKIPSLKKILHLLQNIIFLKKMMGRTF